MAYQVVYFTRTGNSKRIAEKIASRLSADVLAISDGHSWKGFWGFFIGGFYSSIDKKVRISVEGELDPEAEYVLVAPTWAGKLAPAGRAFIAMAGKERIHLVATHSGGGIKDALGCLSLGQISDKETNEDVVVDQLVKPLLG